MRGDIGVCNRHVREKEAETHAQTAHTQRETTLTSNTDTQNNRGAIAAPSPQCITQRTQMHTQPLHNQRVHPFLQPHPTVTTEMLREMHSTASVAPQKTLLSDFCMLPAPSTGRSSHWPCLLQSVAQTLHSLRCPLQHTSILSTHRERAQKNTPHRTLRKDTHARSDTATHTIPRSHQRGHVPLSTLHPLPTLCTHQLSTHTEHKQLSGSVLLRHLHLQHVLWCI